MKVLREKGIYITHPFPPPFRSFLIYKFSVTSSTIRTAEKQNKHIPIHNISKQHIQKSNSHFAKNVRQDVQGRRVAHPIRCRCKRPFPFHFFPVLPCHGCFSPNPPSSQYPLSPFRASTLSKINTSRKTPPARPPRPASRSGRRARRIRRAEVRKGEVRVRRAEAGRVRSRL